jgi:hypothetical protein
MAAAAYVEPAGRHVGFAVGSAAAAAGSTSSAAAAGTAAAMDTSEGIMPVQAAGYAVAAAAAAAVGQVDEEMHEAVAALHVSYEI